MSARVLIDKNSPVPAYHQIATDLLDRIAEGEWPIHTKMPTEATLAAQYDVSRITLRKALSSLEAQKVIEIHQGKGIYVSSTPKPFIENLNFPGTTSKSSQSISKPQVLKIERATALSPTIREALRIGKDDPAIYIKRIFTRENIVIGLNRVWFPESAVPGMLEQGLVDDGIGRTLKQRHQYQIQQVESFVEAARMSVQDAAQLKVPYDSNTLKIQSIYYLDKKTPIQYSSTLWLGDLTRFHIVVKSDDPYIG